MGIRNLFTGGHKRKIEQSINTSNVPFIVSNGNIQPSKYVSTDTALANSDIYAVVSRIASDVAAALRNPKVDDAYVKNIIVRPNNIIAGYNFWLNTVTQLLINGNAFCYIVRDEAGHVQRLEFIPNDSMDFKLISDKDTNDLKYTITFPDGTVGVCKPDEILHFKLIGKSTDFTQQYIGVSPLMSLATDIDIQDYNKRLALNTVANATNPRFALVAPNVLKLEDKQALYDGFKKANENHQSTMVLDAGAKLQQISLQPEILEFLNSINWSQAQIAKAFGIPSNYLDNSAGDQQSSIEMTRSLYANSLQTYINPIEAEMSLKFGVDVQADEADAIDLDHQQLIDNIAKLANATKGGTPIMSAEHGMSILHQKGVF